jgi:hypothetical protein
MHTSGRSPALTAFVLCERRLRRSQEIARRSETTSDLRAASAQKIVRRSETTSDLRAASDAQKIVRRSGTMLFLGNKVRTVSAG